MKRAFTLLELLVSISIILILVALLQPVFRQARRAAHETAVRSDLRQTWLALSLYRETEGDFPHRLEAARLATHVVPASQSGNPWDPRGSALPAPTLGQFGYARLIDRFQRREDWEAQTVFGHRYILASIRFSDPLALPFEGERPENLHQLVGTGPDARLAYVFPNRTLAIEEDGHAKTFLRVTPGYPALQVTTVVMSWPQLFFYLGDPRN